VKQKRKQNTLKEVLRDEFLRSTVSLSKSFIRTSIILSFRSTYARSLFSKISKSINWPELNFI